MFLRFGMKTIIHDTLNIKNPLLITYFPIYYPMMHIHVHVHGTLDSNMVCLLKRSNTVGTLISSYLFIYVSDNVLVFVF